MITLYSAMLVLLGVLLAALFLVFFLPVYRRRVERFAKEEVKRSLPMTEAEIRAHQDRLRAEYAMKLHKLESKLETADLSAARQSVELNRRDAKIHDLDMTISTQKMSVEEHENARRVLEQAILDRLPKVEARLAETRKMLAERDRQLSDLTASSAKQAAALEEATQINTQQGQELSRVKSALETRAARNRDTIGDPRFDGEVALRSELEQLRAQTRDQAQLIDKLQTHEAGSDVAEGAGVEVDRLRSELARVEAQVAALRADSGSGDEDRQALEARLRDMEATDHDQRAQISRLTAALEAAQSVDSEDARAAITAKAELTSLRSTAEEQRLSIQALRAELAAANEKLARQATHFRDELRRLGSEAHDAEFGSGAAEPRRSLAERISAPRIVRIDAPDSAVPAARDSVRGTFLKAIQGSAAAETSAAAAVTADASRPAEAVEPEPRRPRLLDRLSSIDKS